MKICQVMLAKGFGGAERYFVDLSLALARQGHDVLAICHKHAQSRKLLEGKPGIEVRTLSVFAKWDPFAIRNLHKVIESFAPDIVQAHLARGALMSGKVTKKLGIPLLVHTHNFVNLKYYKNVDKFIPATQAQHDYLTSHGIAEGKIRLIRNFSAFKPVDKIETKTEIRKIISHGRFVYKKGFDLLIRSFASLADDKLELHIAGDGPERPRVMKLVSELGLENRVYLPGWQNDIRSFLLQGDLFVLPSRNEPFGIALLEAMACGIPIVSTKCHGPREILDESVAYLCEVDSLISLTDALQAALKEPQRNLSKTQVALALFKDKYSIEKAVLQFEELYQNTLV